MVRLSRRESVSASLSGMAAAGAMGTAALAQATKRPDTKGEPPVGNDALKFRHVCIDPDPPGSEHDITLIADLNGDGRKDIIVGGKKGDVNLFWYENPGPGGGTWTRHDMASAPNLEAGGVVVDVNGDGRPDVVAGQQIGGRELYWFECPEDPTQLWTKRVIENRFEKYHDQAVGDVDGDGQPEIVFASQRSEVVGYYDIPADPTVSPWPQDHCHLVADKVGDLEGLMVVDIDADGRNEIVVGPNILRPGDRLDGPWRRESFARGYVKTRAAVADLDGDGRLDIVLSEGESDPGRLAWCSPPAWEPQVLRADLFHPHSLEIADFNSDGLPDICTAEMGLGGHKGSRLIIYVNRGGGQFTEVAIARGIPAHEAKVGDLTGDGRPDIVGKPYDPERHIDVWLNET